MTLRRQLLQTLQVQTVVGQGIGVPLCLLQLVDGGLVQGLDLLQFVEPAVLQFKLLELCLTVLQLLLRVCQSLIQFGAGLGGQRGDAAGLVLQQLVGFAGLLALVEGALAQPCVDLGGRRIIKKKNTIVVVSFEEGEKLALGEHNRVGILLDVNHQTDFELALVLHFPAGQHLSGFHE